MNQPGSSVETLQWIDRLCDEFERAFRAGENPRIEAVIQQAVGDGRVELLEALLNVELELCEARDDPPQLADFESRFPEHQNLVGRVFANAGLLPANDTAAPRADLTDQQERPAVPFHAEDVDFLAPPQGSDEIGRLGHYRVQEVMGVGGMGVVFRAEDPDLQRQVALKAMKPAIAASRSARERFLREAKATAAIEHDNIVTIYHVGEDRHVPFIAMQFLRGESLQSRLDRVGRLDDDKAAWIGQQVAAGLNAAHQQLLIHRDIKPDNIWIEETSERARILDFGLVRGASDSDKLTQAGMLLGTPLHMAPEQARGEAVDCRCDLFSLGTVLYHMVSGRPPFEAGSLTATLAAVTEQAPRPLEELQPGIDPALAGLVMQLLEKQPDQRPRSAADVERRLADFRERAPAREQLEPQTSEVALAKSPDIQEVANRVSPPVNAKPEGRSIHHRAMSSRRIAFAMLLLLLGGLATAGIALRLRTPNGTVVVSIDGQGEPLTINVLKDHALTLKDPNDGQQIKITIDSDRKQLRLKKAGFELVVKKFQLESRAGRRLTVRFVPTPSVAGVEVRPAEPGVLPAKVEDWPSNLPALAIAPLTKQAARRHQEAWSRHLGLPIEQEITLPGGQQITLVLIPPGEFEMGSSEADRVASLNEATKLGDRRFAMANLPAEGRQHRVRVSQPFYLGKYELTQAQWTGVMNLNPSRHPGANHPVDSVSYLDAQMFLEEVKSRARGELVLHLPTEAQWEYASRAGTLARFTDVGSDAKLDEYAWYGLNSTSGTKPVGELKPNQWGLHDTLGNVWELCHDRYAAHDYAEAPAKDPSGPEADGERTARGGAWDSLAWRCRPAMRTSHSYSSRRQNAGLRVTMTVGNLSALVDLDHQASDPDLIHRRRVATPSWYGWPEEAPPPATAPFSAENACEHQLAWAEYLDVPVEFTNGVGIRFRLVPPGEFIAGSTLYEVNQYIPKASQRDKNWLDCIASEAPRHRVVIREPFYLSVNEITQQQYQQVTGLAPSTFAATGKRKEYRELAAGLNTDQHPVETVSWNEALHFCALLNQKEEFYSGVTDPQSTDGAHFLTTLGYRLPTDAEWEFACRAGTQSEYWFGNDDAGLVDAGWIGRNSEKRPHAVGQKAANAFGLHDMLGNVFEYCLDAWNPAFYQLFAERTAVDRCSRSKSSGRLVRGGDFGEPPLMFRSAARYVLPAKFAARDVGLRLALPVRAITEPALTARKSEAPQVVSDLPLVATLAGHSRLVRNLKFSPSGDLLASSSYDRSIRLWDVSEKKQLKVMTEHEDIVYAIAFSPQGDLLASASRDKHAMIWDVKQGRLVAKLPEQVGWVMSVAFSPDGRRLATGQQDGSICIWDVASGEQVAFLKGHEGWVRTVAFSADGRRLLSSHDSQLTMWDLDTGEPLRQMTDHKSEIAWARLGPQDSILSLEKFGWLMKWTEGVSQLVFKRSTTSHFACPTDLRWIAVSEVGQAAISSLKTGEHLATIKSPGLAIYVAASPNGQLLATTSADHRIRLWDTSGVSDNGKPRASAATPR